MDEHIDPQDSETVERLRALGRQPVAPATASTHLTAMAAAAPRRSPWRTKVAVAGAFLAGLLLGGTGLATAGALPDSAQAAAFNVLHPIGLNVPHPHADDPCKGPPPWALERRPPTAQDRAEREQARADCPQDGESRGGPPAHAGRGGPEGTPGEGRGRGRGASGARPHAGDPCKGPPEWAGPPTGATAEERAQSRARQSAEHESVRAACPPDEAGVSRGAEPSTEPGSSADEVAPQSESLPEGTIEDGPADSEGSAGTESGEGAGGSDDHVDDDPGDDELDG